MTDYKLLNAQVDALLRDEADALANAANFVALLYNALDDVNWLGWINISVNDNETVWLGYHYYPNSKRPARQTYNDSSSTDPIFGSRVIFIKLTFTILNNTTGETKITTVNRYAQAENNASLSEWPGYSATGYSVTNTRQWDDNLLMEVYNGKFTLNNGTQVNCKTVQRHSHSASPIRAKHLVLRLTEPDRDGDGVKDINDDFPLIKRYSSYSDGFLFNQVKQINAQDKASNHQFGKSVATDGITILVGAPNKNSGAGAVYVFNKDNDIWPASARKAHE